MDEPGKRETNPCTRGATATGVDRGSAGGGSAASDSYDAFSGSSDAGGTRTTHGYPGMDEYEDGGFTLPNGDFVEPQTIIEQVSILDADYTALHELGHMLGIQHTFPFYVTSSGKAFWPQGKGFLRNVPSDVKSLWNKASEGNEDAIEQLSNLVMNYPEGKKNVPIGAGKKTNASKFTTSQRTQIWNSAVKDQKKRLTKQKEKSQN